MMEAKDALLTKLEELIMIMQAPKVPANKELWSSAQTSAYLGLTKKKFMYDVACKPNFPKPRNVGGSTNSTNYRWLAGEVMSWAEAQKITH
jgi:predicted DNA-binding transcriptional regulator AlpA